MISWGGAQARGHPDALPLATAHRLGKPVVVLRVEPDTLNQPSWTMAGGCVRAGAALCTVRGRQ